MRTRSLLLPLLLLGATIASANEPQTTPTTQPAGEQPAHPAASQLRGEVVRVDPEAKVLHLKAQADGSDLGELALSVQGDAEAALTDLKAGDSVTVTCREGTSGAGCVVAAVEKTRTS